MASSSLYKLLRDNPRNNKICNLLEVNNLNLMDPIIWPFQTSEYPQHNLKNY